MKFGFSAPISGAMSAPDSMIRVAVEGEAMGYDYLTVSDHIVIPNDINARYPYSATGEFPAGSRQPRHEQLTAIAFIAARTSRIRLLTSVMVVPHRPAVLTAKIISTIDILSNGRVELGVGAGWMREEFEAIGAPDFDARGRVTDEYLAAMKSLWTDENPSFDGEFVKFSDIAFEPKPVQKGGPNIWVGGESGPALRRTARLGDAWYPIGTNPANPLDSLKRLKTQVARLRKMTEEAGRKPDAVGVTLRVTMFGEKAPATAGDGERAGGTDPDRTPRRSRVNL